MTRSKNSEDTILRSQLFAERLKSERSRLNLSQSTLSINTEISIDTIRSLEGGRIQSPSLFLSYKLAKALGGNINTWMEEIENQLP